MDNPTDPETGLEYDLEPWERKALTRQRHLAIYRDFRRGETRETIARRYGLAVSTVRRIIQRGNRGALKM